MHSDIAMMLYYTDFSNFNFVYYERLPQVETE